MLTNIDPGVALTILDRALSIQVTYGAVMLSFLGVCPAYGVPLRVQAYMLEQERCTGEWNSRALEVTRVIHVSH